MMADGGGAVTRPADFPKRKSAPSVYNLFVKERFEEHKSSDPSAAAGEIMRKIADDWKSVTDDYRQVILSFSL